MPSTSMTFTCSDPGLAAKISLTYSSLGQLPRLELSGSGTYVVDLAFVPAAGCKGLLVVLDALDAAGAAAAPLTLTWTSNAVSKSEELTAGGAFMIASPAPVHGVTALSLVHTGNAVVSVIALG